MIKDYTPQPYDGFNPLPTYATNLQHFVIEASVLNGYQIILAKLTVGESVSAGNPLSHALFESFTDHGYRRKVARTRVSGYDREFVAVRSAMSEAGIEFNPALPCSNEDIMRALCEWFMAHNPDISSCTIYSPSCHKPVIDPS